MHDGSLGSGYEKANAMRHLAANPGKPTGKQRREAAEEADWADRSGEVTVRQAQPVTSAAEATDDW